MINNLCRQGSTPQLYEIDMLNFCSYNLPHTTPHHYIGFWTHFLEIMHFSKGYPLT